MSAKLRACRGRVVGTEDDSASPLQTIPSDLGRTFGAVTALQVCPSCGSDLVQPLRWQQRRNGELLVELRCPECHVVMQACHSAQEMEELDRRQSAGRDQIRAHQGVGTRGARAGQDEITCVNGRPSRLEVDKGVDILDGCARGQKSAKRAAQPPRPALSGPSGH